MTHSFPTPLSYDLIGHFTARGGTIMIEHIAQCFPQQRQVIFRKARALRALSEWSRDEAMGAVQAVWDDMLAAHGAIIRPLIIAGILTFLLFGFVSCSHARDRNLQRSEEHTSELQSLMRISYTVFCLKI